MNRRIFLLALAIPASLAMFVVSKSAASWRPVKVAVIDPPKANGPTLAGPTISFRTQMSEREIIFPTVGNDETVYKLFDLQTGQVRAAKHEGIVAGGNGHWEFKGGKTPQLLVRQNAVAERAYALPAADAAELNAFSPGVDMVVAANKGRVEMVLGAHYYRWNASSRALERSTNLDMESALSNQAIARDGQSIINGGLSQISALSTQSGEFTRHSKLAVKGADGAHVSAFGAVSLYEPVTNSPDQSWRVLETAGARELWTFQLGNWQDDAVLMSPDERWLAIARADRKVWELHDAQTGAVVKTLALVPGANAGAFSPDGDTLYSVANGTLYRQRAR